MLVAFGVLVIHIPVLCDPDGILTQPILMISIRARPNVNHQIKRWLLYCAAHHCTIINTFSERMQRRLIPKSVAEEQMINVAETWYTVTAYKLSSGTSGTQYDGQHSKNIFN